MLKATVVEPIGSFTVGQEVEVRRSQTNRLFWDVYVNGHRVVSLSGRYLSVKE